MKIFAWLLLFLIPAQAGQDQSYFCKTKPNLIYPGRSFVVICPSDATQIQWAGRLYVLNHINEKESVTYLGVPLSSAALTQNLKITLKNKTENHLVQIQKHSYPLEVIRLQPQKQGLVAPEKLNNESNIIGAIFRIFSIKKQWQGRFLMPAHGRISSDFGIRRDYYVESKKVSEWQHRGVDITAPIGTEIIAPASGKIVLSTDFESHGGTIMIDHGLGVVSVFNHLKTRKLEKGTLVSAGEVIATMGDSGIATGSNVHWGLSVNGVRVDPLQWVEQGF